MKRRGFTLIELLTVILILGIVALIAIPTVNKIIKKAKEGAVRSSAIAYINAVEDYLAICKISDCDVQLVVGQTYQVSAEKYEVVSIIDYLIPKVYAEELPSETIINDLVNLKGTMPTSGVIVIGNDSNIDLATLYINGYNVEYDKDNGITSINKDSNIPAESIAITNGDVAISKGDTLELNVELTPSDASRKQMEWASSDENIATVSSTGLVTGVGLGETTITVTTRNGKSNSITVQVTGPIKTFSARFSNGSILLLDKNNIVWGSGQNENYSLGIGVNTAQTKFIKATTDTKFKKISSGACSTVAIDEDGYLWSWGCNGNGTLGTGDKVLQTSPIKIPIDTKFKEIIASNYAYYAIDEQNCLWSWGTGFYGELGLDTITQQLSPKKVDDLLKFKSVEVLPSSNSSVFALDMEGNIWSWGYNDIGQLGLGNLTNKTVPNKIIIGVKFKSISTSFYSKSVAAIDENDHLWSWGKNDYGQLGLGNKINQKTPVCVDNTMMVKEVGLGSTHTAVLDMDGYLYTTGNGSVLGMGNTGTAELKLKKVSSTEKYKDILVDDTATYVININNDLYGFGQNSSNRFGNKSMSYYYVPTLIKSAVYQVFLTGYSKTSAFIIDLDGNLWAGGQNLSGQLGIGTNVNPDVFTPVSLVE